VKFGTVKDYNDRCLNEETAISVINNHFLFMISLPHVTASTRPSSGRLHTKEHKYSTFC